MADKSKKSGAHTKDSLFERHNRLLARYPLAVNAVEAAIIASAGCLISQIISGYEVFNWTEVRTMALINFAFNTPVLLVFFKFLNTLSNIYVKLIVDQFLFSPVFNACIISLRLFLLGSDVAEIPTLLRSVLPTAIKSAWMFWVPTRFLIMSYISNDLQILVGAMSGLVWNVIFSMILSK